MKVYTVDLFSRRKVIAGNHFFGIPTYRIFSTREAAERFVENFEKEFTARGKRDVEGYVDVLFEIKERTLCETAEEGKEEECLTGHPIM